MKSPGEGSLNKVCMYVCLKLINGPEKSNKDFATRFSFQGSFKILEFPNIIPKV